MNDSTDFKKTIKIFQKMAEIGSLISFKSYPLMYQNDTSGFLGPVENCVSSGRYCMSKHGNITTKAIINQTIA